MKLNINCDMGESYGRFRVGNDEELMPFIHSCNIACGFHGGDALTIQKTISLAIENNIKIGAHPSYPDLQGFGRRSMNIPFDELKTILQYQISALKGMVEIQGEKLDYIKPHGALYNDAAKNEKEASAIIEAVKEINPELKIMGLAGSNFEKLVKENSLSFISEAFGDRTYEIDSSLTPRKINGSVIINPEESVKQIFSILKDKNIETRQGKIIEINAQSICIHGDNPNALQILKLLQKKWK